MSNVNNIAEPAFNIGQKVRWVDGDHYKKGTILKIKAISKEGNGWFIHLDTRFHSCKYKYHTVKSMCGGHFPWRVEAIKEA